MYYDRCFSTFPMKSLRNRILISRPLNLNEERAAIEIKRCRKLPLKVLMYLGVLFVVSLARELGTRLCYWAALPLSRDDSDQRCFWPLADCLPSIIGHWPMGFVDSEETTGVCL